MERTKIDELVEAIHFIAETEHYCHGIINGAKNLDGKLNTGNRKKSPRHLNNRLMQKGARTVCENILKNIKEFNKKYLKKVKK